MSVEIETVLREIVASACALANAGYGGIATWDSSGQLREYVTGGLSPGEQDRLRDLRDASELWAYMREETQPLRLKDLSAHLVSLGLPGHSLMERSFMGMPIGHRDPPEGYLYLLDKEAGREFTEENVEVLSLFASQAGAAIANGRRYQDGIRAKADLEALIDTSPVGVVVFDARSGQVLSYNQEIRRIVGDLDVRDRSIKELLDVVTVRRSDGRKLEPEEYQALVGILRDARTVRAEEIIHEFPDGRKITTLVNVTPIVSDQGAVLSVVATVQDMTPIEEQERQRAEFLSMVNHEMRAPLATIKGCASTALGSSFVLHPAGSEQFFIDLPADLPRVRADQQRIVQVVGNLLSNATRHSPESSTIRVEAVPKDLFVEVSVVDEGSGMPTERLPHLFRRLQLAAILRARTLRHSKTRYPRGGRRSPGAGVHPGRTGERGIPWACDRRSGKGPGPHRGPPARSRPAGSVAARYGWNRNDAEHAGTV